MATGLRGTAEAPLYQVVPDWEQLPAGWLHGDVVGVAVDSRDRLYAVTRRTARCIVYEPDGTFVTSFGEDVLTEQPHALTIDAQDNLYIVDGGDHTVKKFSSDGTLLQTLGTPGVPSETGYDGENAASIVGGPPFNLPTKAAIGPNGEIFVSDGYGNARIHRFSAAGELLASWGEQGSGPGQFNLPHGVWVADNRVFVADRENDRVQVFSLDGDLLEIWDHIQRPTDIYVDARGLLYVTSLPWRAGASDFGNPARNYSLPGGVNVLDLNGNILTRWGSAESCAAGGFVAPHGVVADSRGDVYVGEVASTFGAQLGYVPEGCKALQKFKRV